MLIVGSCRLPGVGLDLHVGLDMRCEESELFRVHCGVGASKVIPIPNAQAVGEIESAAQYMVRWGNLQLLDRALQLLEELPISPHTDRKGVVMPGISHCIRSCATQKPSGTFVVLQKYNGQS